MGNPDDESWRQRLTVYCIRFAITDLLFAFYAFMARKVFLSCSYVTEHHAFQNTYLLTFTIDIIDCWKLTSLIIALQMVFVSKRLNEAGFLSSFYLLIWLVVTCSLIFGAKIQIKLPGHPFLASLVRLKNETFWVTYYTLIIRVPYFLQIRVGWILHIFFCKFKVCFAKISFSQKKNGVTCICGAQSHSRSKGRFRSPEFDFLIFRLSSSCCSIFGLFLSLLLLGLGVGGCACLLYCWRYYYWAMLAAASLHKSKKGLWSCSCGLYCIGEEANQSLRD